MVTHEEKLQPEKEEARKKFLHQLHLYDCDELKDNDFVNWFWSETEKLREENESYSEECQKKLANVVINKNSELEEMNKIISGLLDERKELRLASEKKDQLLAAAEKVIESKNSIAYTLAKLEYQKLKEAKL